MFIKTALGRHEKEALQTARKLKPYLNCYDPKVSSNVLVMTCNNAYVATYAL